MDTYLKKCVETTRQISLAVRALWPLAVSLIVMKMLLVVDIGVAEWIFYSVLAIIIPASLIIDKIVSHRLSLIEKAAPEIAELKKQMSEMQSKVNVIALRYGFESQLP